jgi:hypothetical protein
MKSVLAILDRRMTITKLVFAFLLLAAAFMAVSAWGGVSITTTASPQAFDQITTVAADSDCAVITADGCFAQQTNRITARRLVLSIERDNTSAPLSASTDLATWTEILPPGAVYSPNVLVVDSIGHAAFAAVPPTTNGLRIQLVRCTPQITRVEFHAAMRPKLWTLEGSTDLVNWRMLERCATTNDFAPKVPMLRDNAQLVTWLLVSPQTERAFYRLKIP